MPIFRLCCRSSALLSLLKLIPSKITSPVVGFIILLMQRSNVDFPAPEGPIMATISPFSTEKHIFFSAVVVAYSFVTLLHSKKAILRSPHFYSNVDIR